MCRYLDGNSNGKSIGKLQLLHSVCGQFAQIIQWLKCQCLAEQLKTKFCPTA